MAIQKIGKTLALLVVLLVVASLVWRVHVYREAHEKSPLVRVSVSQEDEKETKENFDNRGRFSIDVTNLDSRTIALKEATLIGRSRAWLMFAPTSETPTLLIEPQHTASFREDVDFSQSLPENFTVVIETTRGKYRQQVTVTSSSITRNAQSTR